MRNINTAGRGDINNDWDSNIKKGWLAIIKRLTRGGTGCDPYRHKPKSTPLSQQTPNWLKSDLFLHNNPSVTTSWVLSSTGSSFPLTIKVPKRKKTGLWADSKIPCANIKALFLPGNFFASCSEGVIMKVIESYCTFLGSQGKLIICCFSVCYLRDRSIKNRARLKKKFFVKKCFLDTIYHNACAATFSIQSD